MTDHQAGRSWSSAKWLHSRRLVVALTLLAAAACSGSSSEPALGPVEPTTTPSAAELTTLVEPSLVVIETFDAEGLVPVSRSALPFQVVTGRWVVSQGELLTADIPQLLPYYMVADAGSAEGLRQVTMPVTANGAGIVFRFQDVRNHWRLTAARGFATWSLVKVVDGESIQVGNSGLATTDDGATIGVMLADDLITVTVDGRPRVTFSDSDLADARGTGLVAIGGQAALARWDDMVVIAIDYEVPEAGVDAAGLPIFADPDPDPDPDTEADAESESGE